MAILTICPPAARLQWAFLTNAETDYDGHRRFRHRRSRWFDGHWMREGRMKQAESESFPADVARKLKTYVYRLIDPRNGETFYVGKGQGNRVFAHIGADQNLEGDDLDNKLMRMREIRLAGLEVVHVIHRYSADPAVFRHKALLITVNKSATERALYEAVRYAWKISKSHARQAEVILATLHGLIVGAFVADEWVDATAANFPGRGDAPGRAGFVGQEAPDDIKALYVGKRVPEKYTSGAQNPIRYTWTA